MNEDKQAVGYQSRDGFASEADAKDTPGVPGTEAPSSADAILRELVAAEQAWRNVHPIHRVQAMEKGETRLQAAWKAARAYINASGVPAAETQQGGSDGS